jgi:hypothetical protein
MFKFIRSIFQGSDQGYLNNVIQISYTLEVNQSYVQGDIVWC